MNAKWAVRLDRADGAALGPLRQLPEVEVRETDDALWTRGGEADDDLQHLLRTLPGRRFDVLADGQLVAAGSRVPRDRLPDGPWVALARWFKIALPPAAFAGLPGEPVPLRPRRGGGATEANVLLARLDRWRAYAETAAQARLDRLTFAGDGTRAVIRGLPLPALPGAYFVEQSGVAAPAGWTWTPSVDADVLRARLGLEEGDLALLAPDGGWQRVRADDFVRATRSAVRQTARGGEHV